MSTFSHPEWEKENSLTSPSDRDISRNYEPNQGHRPLTEDEVKDAMESLNNNKFVKKFLSVERKYADPVDISQKIGLFSFVPAKGATPNDKGIYGFAKLRGNYSSENEANEKAEFLIRNVDSYHQIYHTYVGRPFPCTTLSDFSNEKIQIDIKKSMTESISNSIKNKKKDEMKEIQEIKEREEKLKEESKREDEDPYEFYTTLKVKKAQVTWVYLETLKKAEEMKQTIIKTRQEIEIMDKENTDFANTYFDKYKKARSEAGLDNSECQDTFMKFLVEDAILDF